MEPEMLAEWTAECSADAPLIAVPWSAAEAGWVDLRQNPYDLAEIPEAEAFPALARALRSLNAPRSPFLTSKCDVWTPFAQPLNDDDELEALRVELDLAPEDTQHGASSYIDLLWRDRSLFGSAHRQQEMLDRLTRRAERLPHPEAALACVLRPAVASLGGSGAAAMEGYGFTLYLRAVAPERAIAIARWAAALDDVTALLRAKELAPARGSATIDGAAGG